jgi:aspartate kinase
MRIAQKFGGTSVGSLERIRKTADIVEREWKDGHEVAVVVSAMSGETNRLLQMARDLDYRAAPRELDALISTGEQVSAALLAIELCRRGLKAFSYNGMQVGFQTSNHFTRARIRGMNADKFLAHMSRREIPVFTGFQGMDEEGNITTLGRGGSDTSAVAVAIALKADSCDIYTDVDGIYSTDPRIVPRARKIEHISFEEMLEFASLGAKVLQTRSVELAMRYNMPIHLRSSFKDVPGTLVTQEDKSMERASVTGVAYNRDEAKVTVQGIPDRPGIAASLLGPVAEAGINVDVIVQNVSEQGFTDLTFTVPSADLDTALDVIRKQAEAMQARNVVGGSGLAKVSIIGVGMRSHAGVAQKMFETLAKADINIHMISTSEIKVTVVIATKDVDAAVQALHTAFGLDVEENATVG